MNDKLVLFYHGLGKDTKDRTIRDIHDMSDPDFENNHDFIQWMFPTKTPSRFNPDAPLLDDETICRLKDSHTFPPYFEASLVRFFRFLEIDYKIQTDGEFQIVKIPVKGLHWLQSNNHNLLRLARVMECCKLLGYQKTAESLFEALLDISRGIPHVITPTNLYFWYHAAFKSA